MQKQCPQCESLFSCQAENITDCQCSTVLLRKETIQFLSKTCFDCLCKNCLQKTEERIAYAAQFQFPTNKSMFIENVHYYIENSNWVFTELYHTLRGSCCQSGCRHCVYGFRK